MLCPQPNHFQFVSIILLEDQKFNDFRTFTAILHTHHLHKIPGSNLSLENNSISESDDFAVLSL